MPIAVMLARNTLNVIVDPSFAAGITSRTDFGSMPQTIHRCGAENTSMCGAALIIQRVWNGRSDREFDADRVNAVVVLHLYRATKLHCKGAN